MGGLARRALVLAAAARAGSSLHTQLQDNPAGSGSEVPPEGAEPQTWMEAVLADMLADDLAFGPDAGMLRMQEDDLNGFERADVFNACKVRYRAPSRYQPMPLVNAERRLIYFLEGKSGSSTLRDTMKPEGPWDKYGSESAGFTRFTFVRDPVSRMISAWFESGLACSAGKGEPLYWEDPASEESRALVLGWFEEYVGRQEKGGPGSCWGPHEGGQRGRLPNPQEGPGMDFVGALSRIETDWRELAGYQRGKFGIAIADLHPPHRVSREYKRLLLNASILPEPLVARICSIFLDDYCCFQLPIPTACGHIDCAVAMQ